jgi:hypothetical protein
MNCKIRREGRLFYASAGMGIGIEQEDDIGKNIIQKILRGNGSIERKAADIADEIVFHLNTHVRVIPYETKNLAPILQIIIFGFENDSPFLGRVDFPLLIDSKTQAFNIGRTPLIRGETIVAGRSFAVNDAVKDKGFWSVGPVAAIEDAIRLQTQASPDVGGNISILRVRKTGADWVKRAHQCPDF